MLIVRVMIAGPKGDTGTTGVQGQYILQCL